MKREQKANPCISHFSFRKKIEVHHYNFVITTVNPHRSKGVTFINMQEGLQEWKKKQKDRKQKTESHSLYVKVGKKKKNEKEASRPTTQKKSHNSGLHLYQPLLLLCLLPILFQLFTLGWSWLINPTGPKPELLALLAHTKILRKVERTSIHKVGKCIL